MKVRFSLSSNITLRKEKMRKNNGSEEKERGEVQKSDDCTLSFFYIGLLELLKEKKRLFDGKCLF